MVASVKDNSTAIAGTIAGFAVAGGIKKVPDLIINGNLLNGMRKTNLTLSQPEKDILEKATSHLLDLSDVKKHGVKIKHVDEKTVLSISEKLLLTKIDNELLPRHIKEMKKEMMCPTYAVQKGNNAFFNMHTNNIIYNKNKMPLAVFHEVGHAQNKFQSKLGNVLQFLRRQPKAGLRSALLISSLAIIMPSKTEQQLQKPSKGDKLVSMFRDNAGIISAAMFTPAVIEEAMATQKGNKLAKKLLNPELFKKVKHVNNLGFMTYLMAPIAIGVGTFLGVKAKDKIIANSLNKK